MSRDLDVTSEDLRDPCPNLQELFVYYNALYFENLLGACVVQWSSERMTRYHHPYLVSERLSVAAPGRAPPLP